MICVLVFDLSVDRRKGELTINKNIKGKYLFRTMLKDVFGFVEHQEKATYVLGYKLPLTKNKDDAFIYKAVGFPKPITKLIISTGVFPIIHPPFNNKEYYLKKI